MEIPVELVPLNCIRCGTPIPAQIEEVAWVCAQCNQGQQLGVDGLIPLKVLYAQKNVAGQIGKPFWVCEGRVTLKRKTYGGSKNQQEAQQFWEQPRPFIIPAFPCSLQKVNKQGIEWLKNPPELQPGPIVPFEPVTVSAGDLQAFIEFLVVALETERDDNVKKIEFDLSLADPELWILPPG